jgi:hypothetical protein
MPELSMAPADKHRHYQHGHLNDVESEWADLVDSGELLVRLGKTARALISCRGGLCVVEIVSFGRGASSPAGNGCERSLIVGSHPCELVVTTRACLLLELGPSKGCAFV